MRIRSTAGRHRFATGAFVALVFILVGAMASPAWAATSEEGSAETSRDTFSITTLEDQIQILSAEQDAEGQVTLAFTVPVPVQELLPTDDNFGVTDAGQNINNFRVTAITTAADVMVVLDTSGSMSSQGAMGAARRAATSFVEAMPENARVGLISFADEVTVHAEPGDERGLLLDAIGSLQPTGETALWDAIDQAGELLDGAEEPFIVALTDGEDTVNPGGRAQALRKLQAAGVNLYAVALETSETDFDALDDAVDTVGGQFFNLTEASQLEDLYTDIAGRLSSRYELSYDIGRQSTRNINLSVAIDDALATATARVRTAGTDSDPEMASEAAPQVLNLDPDDTLGAVVAPEPGLLGSAAFIWIGTGLIFAAFLIFALLTAVPAVNVRLDTAAAVGRDRTTGMGEALTGAADRFIAQRDDDGALDKALDAAGMNVRPGEFMLLTLVPALLLGLLGTVSSMALGIFLAAGVIGLSFARLLMRASRRRDKFAEQMLDTLTILIGALRAGRGLPQAIELVAEEAAEPTAGQFQRVVFETRVGRDLTQSMLGVADRMQNQDLEWTARAMDINRELGGDLIETLTNVANTIRERRRIRRQVQALSAEGRASGWVLLALPIIMLLFMMWRTPEMASLLWTNPTGRVLGIIAITGMIGGYVWIRRMVNIQF